MLIFCPGRAISMELRDMSYYHGYKQRDFHFAQLLVTLRKRASLPQEKVALRVGITERAIGNWEGGSNYPKEPNLQKLIELYLDKNAFEPGHEPDEARALWNQFHESVPRRDSSFDEQWFASLLAQCQAPNTSHEQQCGQHLAHAHPCRPPQAAPLRHDSLT